MSNHILTMEKITWNVGGGGGEMVILCLLVHMYLIELVNAGISL